MSAPHFEKDQKTGLWNWPVLLNGDWSAWTNEPCVVLWGEASGCWGDELVFQTVSAALLSANWPRLAAFRVGDCGFVVMAPSYSSEQAMLLAEGINRELLQLPRSHEASVSGRGRAITWGIVDIRNSAWNVSRALQAAVSPVERAVREMRLGSINEAQAESETIARDDFVVSSGRDSLTELKSWHRTVALCSRYGDEPIALLMGDIDHFKTFNEVYGHGGGDISLQMLAHVLRRFESHDVTAFRSGGDEFIVWARGHSLERARQLAKKINEQISCLQIPVPHQVLVDNVSLTWSVVAASPRDLELNNLLQKAGELLHIAKSENRGLVSAKQL